MIIIDSFNNWKFLYRKDSSVWTYCSVQVIW